MKKVNLLSKTEMKNVMGGNVPPVGDDGEGGGKYKCVFPTGESKCQYYSTTPTECPKDYTGASGTVESC